MGIQAIPALKAFIPRKGGFISNVLTLTTGTALAQGLAVAATPILTRLYTPEDFGVLALFLSVTGIFSVVANWRYELAIVLPEADQDGLKVLALAALIAMGMSGLCLVLVAFFRRDIASLLNAPELAPWLWWAPLSLLLTGLFQGLTNWNIRKKQFRQQAVARVSQSVGMLGTQIGAGCAVSGAGGSGLIIGTLAGQLVGTGLLGDRVFRQQKHLALTHVSPAALWEQAVRYKKFPFLTNFAGLLNQTAYQVPMWLLALFYSPQAVGFYLLANRIGFLPASLIGKSVSQVFLERAAREKNQTGRSIQAFKKTLLLLALLCVVPYIVLMTWGPPLFSLVFGEAWTQAGQFAAILAPLFLTKFIASPLSMINAVHEKQEVGLLWQVGLALLSVLSLIIAHRYFQDINNVLIVFSLLLMVWYLLLALITYRISLGKL